MPVNKLNKWVAECELILPLSRFGQSQWWLRAAISSYVGFTCVLNNGGQYRSFWRTEPCSWTMQCAQCLQTSPLTRAWQQKPTKIHWPEEPSNAFGEEAHLRCGKERVSFIKEKYPKSWDNGSPYKSIAQTTQELHKSCLFSLLNRNLHWNLIKCCLLLSRRETLKTQLTFSQQNGKSILRLRMSRKTGSDTRQTCIYMIKQRIWREKKSLLMTADTGKWKASGDHQADEQLYPGVIH